MAVKLVKNAVGRMVPLEIGSKIYQPFKGAHATRPTGVKATPKIAMQRDELVPIKGMVPSPFRRPTGCHFHSRCVQRFEPCNQVDPAITHLDDHHDVRCLLYEDVQARKPEVEAVAHG